MGRVIENDLENGAKEKRPKGRLIMKTLRRCRSLGSLRKGDHQKQRQMLPPEGCFSVYVGPGRERFTVRTECLNHSLFRALLDEAEMEFGYPAAGPLELPCDVELFRQVLVQVEQDAAELHSPRCNFSKGPPAAGYLLFVNMGSKSAEEMLQKNNGVLSSRNHANNTRENDYKEPFIIGVAGGAASGKNSVSDMIIEQLRDQRVVLVHQESFYFDLTAEELEHVNEYNFDHPDAFDFENSLSCMEKLKRGMVVEVPNYDFITHHRKLPARKVNPSDVIVFEGILVFHDPRVREMMNMKIFVDTDADMRLVRRIKRDTIEKGRDVKAVLDQYSKFVKPAFDEFILPTKKYADVIIPRGGDNQVGVDLIVQHIRTKLGQHNLCKIYPNLYVIHSTFQIRGMHTLIRDAKTTKHDFIFYSDRLIRLVVEQGLAHLPFHEKQVITPTGSIYTGVEYCKKLCGISVIRSGESMENALRECCKGIKIGRILIHRERNSQQLIYHNLPKDIADRHVLLLDPILATGNSIVQAITLLLEKGIQESNIIFLNLISAPQGLLVVCKKFPRVKIVTSAIDYGLNEELQVVPGMGQFGDRYFGTKDD